MVWHGVQLVLAHLLDEVQKTSEQRIPRSQMRDPLLLSSLKVSDADCFARDRQILGGKNCGSHRSVLERVCGLDFVQHEMPGGS
jgi:hypothetical protein